MNCVISETDKLKWERCMKRKKQKIQSIILWIIGIAILAVGIYYLNSRLRPKTDGKDILFSRFESWMDIHSPKEIAYANIYVENMPDEEEKYSQNYYITNQNAIKKLWNVLEDKSYGKIKEVPYASKDTIEWKISFYQEDRCISFVGLKHTDGKQYMKFWVQKLNEAQALVDKDEDYMYEAYYFEGDVEQVILEVIQENIKTLTLEEIRKMEKTGGDIEKIKQYYYIKGENKDIDTTNWDLIECLLEEEGYRLFVQYKWEVNLNVEEPVLDKSIILTRLYHPDGTWEELKNIS